jgi:hypothetical protein
MILKVIKYLLLPFYLIYAFYKITTMFNEIDLDQFSETEEIEDI